MATAQQIAAALRAADAAGNVDDARQLARAYTAAMAGSASTTAPAEEPAEEPGLLGELGRGVVRGTGTMISGLARPLKELTPDAMSGVVDPAADWLKEAGTDISESVAPRATPNLYEAWDKGGVSGALKSLAVTVSEGSAPMLGGALAGVLTKSPAAAMAVMGLTSAPQEYTGIREMQDQTGQDSIGAALAGTAVVTALDIFSGAGKAVSNLSRDAVKELFEQGLRSATKEVLKTGAAESGTEALQTVIEQVAGGADPTTKQSLLDTLEAGLAGTVGGTFFGGVSEATNKLAAARTRSVARGQPALATMDVMVPDTDTTSTLDIISVPDEEGHVIVRSPEGNIRRVSLDELSRMRVAPTVEEEAVTPVGSAQARAEAAMDLNSQAEQQAQQQTDLQAQQDRTKTLYDSAVELLPTLGEAVSAKSLHEALKTSVGPEVKYNEVLPILGQLATNGRIGEPDKKTMKRPVLVSAAQGSLDPNQVALTVAPGLEKVIPENAELQATVNAKAGLPPAPTGGATPSAVPPGVAEWDTQNRNHRADTLFEGDITTRLARNEAVADNGNRAVHGMAKAGTVSGAYRDLVALLQGGIDPQRGGGGLYTDSLASTQGTAGVTGTATGTAYFDGPFALVGVDGHRGMFTSADQLAGVLVNEALAGTGVIEQLRAEFPHLSVEPYSNTAALLKATKATPSATTTAPVVSSAPLTRAKGAIPVADGVRNVSMSDGSTVGLRKEGGVWVVTDTNETAIQPTITLQAKKLNEALLELGPAVAGNRAVTLTQGELDLPPSRFTLPPAGPSASAPTASPVVDTSTQGELDFSQAEEPIVSTAAKEPPPVIDEAPTSDSFNIPAGADMTVTPNVGDMEAALSELGKLQNLHNTFASFASLSPQEAPGHVKTGILPAIQKTIASVKTALKSQPYAARVAEETKEQTAASAADQEASPVGNNIQWALRDAQRAAGRGNFQEALEHLEALEDIATREDYAAEAAKNDPKLVENTFAPAPHETRSPAFFSRAVGVVREADKVTVEGLAESLAVSERAARALVDRLVAAGVLKKPGKKGWVVVPTETVGAPAKRKRTEVRTFYTVAAADRAAADRRVAEEQAKGVAERDAALGPTVYNRGETKTTLMSKSTGAPRVRVRDSEIPALYAALRAALDKVGLSSVDLRLEDSVYTDGKRVSFSPRPGAYKVDGVYWMNTIAVALSAARSGVFTLNHEIIHALKGAGLFTPSEWATLETAARANKVLMAGIAFRYPELSKDSQVEEAIADMFGKWMAGKEQKGVIKAAFARVLAFLGALGNALRGAGFNSASELFERTDAAKVFGSIAEGEFAGRERGPQNTSGAPQASVSQRTAQLMASSNLAAVTTLDKIKSIRSFKDAYELANTLWPGLKMDGKKLLLQALPTRDILRLIKKYTPAIVYDEAAALNRKVQALIVERGRLMKVGMKTAERWEQYDSLGTAAQQALWNAMNFSTLYSVDPSTAPNAAAFLAKEQAASGVIGHKPGRMDEVKDVYEFWNEAGKYGKGVYNGQAIYKEVRDSYIATLNEQERLLKAIITASGGSPADKRTMMTSLQVKFQEVRQIAPYFPLSRDGQYGFIHGKGADRVVVLRETAAARNIAMADYAKSKGTSTRDMIENDGLKVINNAGEKKKQITEAPGLLKDILAHLDKSGGTLDAAAVKKMKEDVYEMFLLTLPDADMRKKFLPRKGTGGFNPDARRAFLKHVHASSYQLARLEYSGEVRNAISQMKGTLNANPNQSQIEPFLDRMEARARAEIEPKSQDDYSFLDKVADVGTQASFFMMLTSMKTALINLTQLPIVGANVLGSRFGYGKTTAMMAKYLKLSNTFGVSERVTTPLGATENQFRMPSVEYSKMMQTPRMRAAFEAGVAQDMFDKTYTMDLAGGRSTPSGTESSALTKGFQVGMNVITGGLHNVERISREIMYMSTYELSYNENIAKGMSAKDAQAAAIEDAIELTTEAMFDYSQYNKPELMRNPVGRLAFQFMTFPMQMISLMVRNAYNSFPFRNLPPSEKKRARSVFFGVLGMTFMFAGMSGMPGMGLVLGMLDGLRDVFRGDDEDDDDELDPLSDNSLEYWLREVWIPQTFGPDSDIAKALGLSATASKLVEQSLISGPVSALTGADFSGSVGLDNLGYHSDQSGNTNKEDYYQGLVGALFGPTGALGAQIASAMDDFGNDDTSRGMEKLFPAFFKGLVRATRLASEGNLTRTGAEIKSAEYYTTGKLALQVIGFGDTEVNQIQKANSLAKSVQAEDAQKKSSLLNRMDKLLSKYKRAQTPEAEAAIDADIDAVYDDIEQYNRRSPDPITGADIRASQDAREQARDRAVYGLVLPKPFARYLRDRQ